MQNFGSQSLRRPQRWLAAVCLCLGLGLGLALTPHPGWAQELAAGVTDPQTSALQTLERVSQDLHAVQEALEDADSTETLQSLADRSLQARRDADSAVTTLEPLLQQLDARIKQLGPVAEGSAETPELTQLRQTLSQQFSDLDSAIRRGRLLSVEARQVGSSIERRRSQQFNAEVTSKVPSPLSPSLWRLFADDLPQDFQRLRSLGRQGHAAFQAAIAKHGWRAPATGILLALLLMFPLRLWLRHLGRQFAASPKAPEGRLRRTGLAVWLLVVGTALPGLASLVLIESLRSIDAVAPRLQIVADAWIRGSFVAAFFLSLSAAVLSPQRPSWRLINVDDLAAPWLESLAWGAAGLTWATLMLNALDIAARTSNSSNVALLGVIALVYSSLIFLALVVINRQRRRQHAAAATNDAASDAPSPSSSSPTNAPAHSRTYSRWLTLAWLGGHLSVSAALIAALLGYLNFSVFVTSQMVWVTMVVLSTSLLMKFIDDFFTWLGSEKSPVSQSITMGSGLPSSRVELISVLLSAVMRVGMLILGLLAVTAPFGNSSNLLSFTDTLSQGLTIGGSVLRPMAILRGLLVLVLGLTLFRALQHWLVHTYLPKTEMDVGARNSISTVTRYAGITLSVLWMFAALGIGFEKIALLASALSVGIGFGLQAITQNFVSGLILLAERPVKLGDRVRIGDQVGDIRRISVRATEIQTDDKSTVIVPNSELITKSVQNITMDGALGRISIAFSVPLSTDIVKLRSILLGLYEEHDNVLATPAPSMFIDSINGGSVAITSFGHVASPRIVYSTRSDLLFGLLQRCAENGIALVYPTTDIRMIQDPPEPSGAPKEEPKP